MAVLSHFPNGIACLGALCASVSDRDFDRENVLIQIQHQTASEFHAAFKKLFLDTPLLKPKDSSRPMFVNRVLTKLGPLICAANDDGLHLLEFFDRQLLEKQIKRVRKLTGCSFVIGENGFHSSIESELESWFAGELKQFETSLVLKGTAFQESVWNQLLKVPYGKTRSYEQIAKKLDNAKAMRAVGKANGDNRFAIVVPCHRLIRADGSLSGYGGGVWRKQWLLNHEKAHA